LGLSFSSEGLGEITILGKPKDFPELDKFFSKLVRAKNSIDKIIMKI
jgi:hypothetical protein